MGDEVMGVNTRLNNGAVVTRRVYKGFVTLFRGDAQGDNGYGIVAAGYTDYVTVENTEYLAYPHFFYKSDQTGSLYMRRVDDEGHASAAEVTIGGIFTTATGSDWKDQVTNTSPPAYGKTLQFRIKNSGSAISNYWLKMAGFGV